LSNGAVYRIANKNVTSTSIIRHRANQIGEGESANAALTAMAAGDASGSVHVTKKVTQAPAAIILASSPAQGIKVGAGLHATSRPQLDAALVDRIFALAAKEHPSTSSSASEEIVVRKHR